MKRNLVEDLSKWSFTAFAAFFVVAFWDVVAKDFNNALVLAVYFFCASHVVKIAMEIVGKLPRKGSDAEEDGYES